MQSGRPGRPLAPQYCAVRAAGSAFRRTFPVFSPASGYAVVWFSSAMK